MTDEQKLIIEGFSQELFDAYKRSGIGSYRELERRLDAAAAKTPSGALGVTRMGRSTAWALLNGDRKWFPVWDQVAQLVCVFSAAACERGIDSSRVGSLAEWKTRHEAAAAAYRAAARTAAPAMPVMAITGPCVAAAPADQARAWWGDYADLVPAGLERYLNHEPLSDLIMSYEPVYVPELLQTPEYAAEVFGLEYGHESRNQLARRVEFRMRRQRHLNRVCGRPVMWAIINEGALRSDLVNTATMRAQVRYLLRMGSHVRIQIVPAGRPAHQAADGPITLLRFRSLQLQDLVYLEHADSALYPSAEEDLAHYVHAVNKLGLAALNVEASRELLHRIAAET